MTITLPDELREQVEESARAAGFDTVDRYVAYLVASNAPDGDGDHGDIPGLESITPRTREQLAAMIEEGMASGPPIPVDEAFWQRLSDRIGRPNGARP